MANTDCIDWSVSVVDSPSNGRGIAVTVNTVTAVIIGLYYPPARVLISALNTVTADIVSTLVCREDSVGCYGDYVIYGIIVVKRQGDGIRRVVGEGVLESVWKRIP